MCACVFLGDRRFDAEQEARERRATAGGARGAPSSGDNGVVFFDADRKKPAPVAAAAAKQSRPMSGRGPRHGVDLVRITQFAAIYRSMPLGWREHMRRSPRFDLLEVREMADALMARSRNPFGGGGGGGGGGDDDGGGGGHKVSVPKVAMLDAVRDMWPTRATDGHMVVDTAFDVLDFGATGQVDLDELFFFETLFAPAELSPKFRQVGEIVTFI
jgi:hypothetical protein